MDKRSNWKAKEPVMIHFLLSLLLLPGALGWPVRTGFPDWLVTEITTPTSLSRNSDGTISLSNGLIRRTFAVTPDFVTIDFYSMERDASLLRAINPEAVIAIDGTVYNVSGFETGIPRAYLNRSALENNYSVNPNAFHFSSYAIAEPEVPFPYTPMRGAPKNISWPPKGLRLDVLFKAPDSAPQSHQQVAVVVHYEMYDGIPLMSKWLTVINLAHPKSTQVQIQSVEILGLNWQWSQQGYQWLFVENDQPHSTLVNWELDTQQSQMPGSFEPQVNCTYDPPTPIPLDKGESVESFKVHELVIGSSDMERQGLAKHRMLRLLAPHTQENPIFFHLTNSTSAAVRAAVDQMAEVGFEMLILSFGSGFNYETVDPAYILRWAEDVHYALDRGIEVGGYDLIALTRTVPKWWMASRGACMASGWYDYLLKHVTSFMNQTGMSMIETDGPYGGYQCTSTNHSHHTGQADSVYWQNTYQAKFFLELRRRGVYINQPDNYFYQGGSKTGMGYNENQYSLPRWQDLSVSRQGMFDDTYRLIPTVGWMFLPLVDYHGGGQDAMFEPLSEHVQEYEWGLAQYLGAGVAACYRGYRLYDTPEVKVMVKKWVTFYKTYRDILTSDIIHVRRADMQGIDAYLHVNPRLKTKGLAMVFNPTDHKQNGTLPMPLYYSGLTDVAKVSEHGGPIVQVYPLHRDYSINLPYTLEPKGITWFVIE